MKVGIVTLYDAPNYGAFFHAYALQKVVAGLGHDVEFLRIDNASPAGILSRSPKRIISEYKRRTALKKALRHLNIAAKIYTQHPVYYDSVILGSDEIWNLDNPSFKHYPIFFGNGVNTKNLITYAPDCGDAVLEHIINNTDAVGGLKNIRSFSARTAQTAAMIEIVTGARASLVLDPTLLLGDFSGCEEPVDRHGFILVYSYGMTEKQVKLVKDFSRRKNLKLVSAGSYNAWCDDNLAVSPFQLLMLVKNADYIISSTFHGTIFPVIYKKQFAVFGRGKNKIESLLKRLSLESRMLGENKEIDGTLDETIDYLKIDDIIAEARKQSMQYLTHALDRVKTR